MVKRDYLEDIEKALKKGKKPTEILNIILDFLNFKSVEIKIYNLLLKTSLGVREMERHLHVSERTIRKYIKRLHQEGFITRKVEEGKRLRYLYSSVPIQEAWKKVEERIQEILSDISKALQTRSMLF